MPAPSMDMVKLTSNLISALESSHIHYCLMWSCASVHTTGSDVPTGGSPYLERGQKIAKFTRDCEEAFLESKIDAKCITRIVFPMQYLFFLSDIIQSKGVLPLAVGHGKFAPVHVKDVGTASAHILSKGIPQEHHSQIYTFTGPQLVTGQEFVDRANKALEGTLTFKESSLDEMKGIFDKLVQEGEMNDFERDILLYDSYLIHENLLSIQTLDLKNILGHEPTTIEAFFEENKSAFRPGLSRFFNRWILNV
ncbi:hypothetical protein HMI55_004737 [Coelomomyces lativittatus]|nr:hypothetical protein HMI55_004737 [Coelomomyces lativittatus]